jgi:hypothetical protein
VMVRAAGSTGIIIQGVAIMNLSDYCILEPATLWTV